MTQKSYLGVDIGGTAVKLGIVDPEGNIGKRSQFALCYDGRSVTPMQAVTAGIRSFLNDSGIRTEALSGIGISCPGLIDSKNGRMTEAGASNIPGMESVPVCEIMEKNFPCPARWPMTATAPSWPNSGSGRRKDTWMWSA